MSDGDFELKTRFTELRAVDERSAPSFEAMRGRADAGVKRIYVATPRRRWLAPALLAVAAAVFAAVWLTARASARAERASVEALLRDSSAHVFRWTMPTDGLLESARRTLQTPALSSSVLDAAAVPIPGNPFKGD